MKKLTVILLILSMVLTLTACGGGVHVYGYYVRSNNLGVRPALWLNP